MIDFLYVLGTAAFFALMLAYVAGCERLGARGASAAEQPTSRPEAPTP